MALVRTRGAPPVDGGEEASWSRLVPGDYVLAWFSDDDVWHELLLTWIGEDGWAAVHTPDGDHYELRLQGDPEEGAVALRHIARSGEIPEGITRRVYRFREYPQRAGLHVLMTKGIEMLDRVEGGARSFEQVVNEVGELEAAAVFFPPARRLREKQPGTRTAPRRFLAPAAQLPVAVPARGGVPQPPPAPPPADAPALPALPAVVGPALPAATGSMWLASEPGGGLVLGQEVTLNPATDLALGRAVAMTVRGGVWIKCELVKMEEAPD